MINKKSNPDIPDNDAHLKAAHQAKSATRHVKSNMSKSMHDGVEVWCDCCSCEAEPYWVEAMQGYMNRDNSSEDKN